MCNLYSMTRPQDAVRRFFSRTPLHDRSGNMPPLPGIFPDYSAPIVRSGEEGRELVMARWGMAMAKNGDEAVADAVQTDNGSPARADLYGRAEAAHAKASQRPGAGRTDSPALPESRHRPRREGPQRLAQRRCGARRGKGRSRRS